MNLSYHDARYADLYEETMYNALLGLDGPGGRKLLLPESAGGRLPALCRGTPARAAWATSRARC